MVSRQLCRGQQHGGDVDGRLAELGGRSVEELDGGDRRFDLREVELDRAGLDDRAGRHALERGGLAFVVVEGVFRGRLCGPCVRGCEQHPRGQQRQHHEQPGGKRPPPRVRPGDRHSRCPHDPRLSVGPARATVLPDAATAIQGRRTAFTRSRACPNRCARASSCRALASPVARGSSPGRSDR